MFAEILPVRELEPTRELAVDVRELAVGVHELAPFAYGTEHMF